MNYFINFPLLAVAVIFLTNASAQTLQWAKKMGGIGPEMVNSMSIDFEGNIYTTGKFYGTVDFDPAEEEFNLTSLGSSDIFVSKLDAEGNFVWANRIGGILGEESKAITTDNEGNIIITGYFRDTVDFYPGPEVFNLISQGFEDIFICKLSGNGDFKWAKGFQGTPAWGSGLSITTDSDGNIYTTGSLSGVLDFDPGIDVYYLSSLGPSDIFISKLNANGNFIWAKSMRGTGDDYGFSIKLDSESNIYTTGTFEGTADFDPGPNVFNITSSASRDVFVSKLDSDGNFIWAKNFAGHGFSIALDAEGNVYTTGKFWGTQDFDPGTSVFNLTSAGNYDMFISKLDSDGNFEWAQRIGGPNLVEGNSIEIDAEGNIYTAGSFSATVDFDPGLGGVHYLTSSEVIDAFVCKLDTDGNFLWAQSIGGFDDGSINPIQSHNKPTLVIDNNGNIHMCGIFANTVDFNPSSTEEFIMTSIQGSRDVFVLKLNDAATNIFEVDKYLPLSVYPNPFTEEISVGISECRGQIELVIRTLDGRYVTGFTQDATKQTIVLDLKKLEKGAYLIEVMDQNTRKVARVVKQ